MLAVAYLIGALAVLMLGQSIILRAFGEPQQWTFGASSRQPKSLKLALKLLLQSVMIGSIFLFPVLVGRSPAEYYGPILPAAKAVHFLWGELIAILLMPVIFWVELAAGWIVYAKRYTPRKALTKSSLSALSSLTVVAVEEPIFRGIVLHYLLYAVPPAAAATGAAAAATVMPLPVALVLGAALFSGAHFIRKLSTYWPAVGLAVLGLWLGVAYYKTGSLWLSMGLHSGGILVIGIHRCFTRYQGPAWLIGTQTFPIAGVISIAVMLLGAAVTWLLFS